MKGERAGEAGVALVLVLERILPLPADRGDGLSDLPQSGNTAWPRAEFGYCLAILSARSNGETKLFSPRINNSSGGATFKSAPFHRGLIFGVFKFDCSWPDAPLLPSGPSSRLRPIV